MCFDRETPPHVNELARSLRMSLGAFSRAFTTECGEHPSEYLKRAQVARAKTLLATTDLPLNQAGYRSGYGTRVSFYRAFKRATGVTPRKYRDSNKFCY